MIYFIHLFNSRYDYYSAVKLYTFFNFVVIVQSSFIQFFNFSSTFLASKCLFSAPRGLLILVVFPCFRVSAQRLEDSISSTCARSWDSRADIDIKRSSRTPLRLSRVPAQGPSTWANLRYLKYLRKGLNQRSS